MPPIGFKGSPPLRPPCDVCSLDQVGSPCVHPMAGERQSASPCGPYLRLPGFPTSHLWAVTPPASAQRKVPLEGNGPEPTVRIWRWAEWIPQFNYFDDMRNHLIAARKGRSDGLAPTETSRVANPAYLYVSSVCEQLDLQFLLRGTASDLGSEHPAQSWIPTLPVGISRGPGIRTTDEHRPNSSWASLSFENRYSTKSRTQTIQRDTSQCLLDDPLSNGLPIESSSPSSAHDANSPSPQLPPAIDLHDRP